MDLLHNGLSLFVMRHGERTDLCFGSHWLEQAFGCGFSSESGSIHHYTRFDLNLPQPQPRWLPRRALVEYADDPPLTMLGWWQAHNAGRALQGHAIRTIYSSPALRCVQTATAVAEALGLCARYANEWKGIRVEKDLLEWMGWYGGEVPKFMTPKELAQNGLLVDTEYEAKGKCGLQSRESMEEVFQRHTKVVKSILEKHREEEGNVLIVGHMMSADSCTFALLHGKERPEDPEIGMGGRRNLLMPFCGVARIRNRGGKWRVADDSYFQQTTSANDAFSFASGKSIEASEQGAKDILENTNISRKWSFQQRHDVHSFKFRSSFGFLLDAAAQVAHSLGGKNGSWRAIALDDLDTKIDRAFLPFEYRILEMLPEWSNMKAWHSGYCAQHVFKTFVATELVIGRRANDKLLLELSVADQNVFSWALLLHDLAKEVVQDKETKHIIRHPSHPFLSAVVAARFLAKQGFALRAGTWNTPLLDDWCNLVASSLIKKDGIMVHDNRNLPSILDGIGRIFGKNQMAEMIVKIVLLHQSLNLLPSYPDASPLSDHDIVTLLDEHTCYMLELFNMPDSAAYSMTDPQITMLNMRTIRANGARIRSLFLMSSA